MIKFYTFSGYVVNMYWIQTLYPAHERYSETDKENLEPKDLSVFSAHSWLHPNKNEKKNEFHTGLLEEATRSIGGDKTV